MKIRALLIVLFAFYVSDRLFAQTSPQYTTLDSVINSAGDTLYVVFDFPVADYQDITDAIQNYWFDQLISIQPNHAIFLCSFDNSFISAQQTLADKNLVIYGSFSSRENNLIRTAFEGTLVQLPGEELIQDNTGIIAAGYNPFGKGFSVSIAAKPVNLLTDILNFYDGDYSLIAVLDNNVVQQINYNLNTEFHLLKVLSDVDFFFNTLDSVHPDLLRNTPDLNFQQLKQDVRAKLEAETDEDSLIQIDKIGLIFAEAAACFQDGHTSVYLTEAMFARAANSALMLPFHLKVSYGEIFIDGTLPELTHLNGKKLLKMNELPLSDFFSPILDKISGERTEYKLLQFINKQAGYLAMVPLTDQSPISVTVEDSSGQTQTENVGLISFPDYNYNIILTNGAQSPANSFYTFYQHDSTCYYQYNKFTYTDSEKQFIDELFSLIEQKNVRNLIIDLRYNGGGNTNIGDYLLNYLASQPYHLFSRVDIKLSEELFKQQPFWRGYGNAGSIYTETSGLKTPQDMGFKYQGKLFLLTSCRTFSSAADFTAVIKDYQFGTIIGEETGGLRQCFGDVLRFTMPNTGINFGVSFKYFYAPVPEIGDDRHGTVPDVELDNEILADYSHENDPTLAFTLDYIKNLETPVEEINRNTPKIVSFHLYHNYPNPFNSTTNIKYTIPKSALVTLKLFNPIGQEVMTLVDRHQSAGEHTCKFTFSGLPSGLFFYRLKAGEFSETKKLILQK
jgi:hypothetical protein